MKIWRRALRVFRSLICKTDSLQTDNPTTRGSSWRRFRHGLPFSSARGLSLRLLQRRKSCSSSLSSACSPIFPAISSLSGGGITAKRPFPPPPAPQQPETPAPQQSERPAALTSRRPLFLSHYYTVTISQCHEFRRTRHQAAFFAAFLFLFQRSSTISSGIITTAAAAASTP